VPAATVTLCDDVEELEPLEAVRVTRCVPGEAYCFAGFRWVEEVPSPKLHAHDVGTPEEVSENWIWVSVFGFAGE
jgi:hypothetical protein